MPGYGSILPTPGGVPRFQKYSVSVSVIDITGAKKAVSIDSFDDNITAGQADDWVEAYGELSNAGVYAHRINSSYEIFEGDAVVYDEAMSDVGSAAVFVFQNREDPRDIIRVPVYAFDLSYVVDGRINMSAGPIDTFVDRCLGIINDGGLIDDGNFRLLKAYITRGRGSDKYAETFAGAPSVEEPGIGDTPGEGPGNNPVI